MLNLYCRIYQNTMKIISYMLPWREPELLVGENSLRQLAKLIKSKGIESVLLITDQGIVSAGLMAGLLQDLQQEKITCTIYDKTVPNPTVDNIEEALNMYHANHCQGIVAFGGGSPMDCAKGVGARVAKPNKTLSQMKGVLKVMKKLPLLFAIPTTAGTGSEATLAAVVTNNKTHEKYAIMDTALIPHYAVLDPALTLNLPRHITSTTGMDALTHAVEAYIGKSNTKETKALSVNAVTIIFQSLLTAYTDGTNVQARAEMQKAAYDAGRAFTRAYVGNVHAIAHTLGGFYSVPHGLANAVILPHVLEYYGDAVEQPLAELADVVHMAEPNDSMASKAKKFIQAVKKMNEDMGIPTTIKEIKDADIPILVQRSLAEANPLYPVPKILNAHDMTKLYHQIKG